MIHKCSTNYCLKEGKCDKNFPKPLSDCTKFSANNEIIYKRIFPSDRYVAPYNPYLLLKYNCHLYVEIIHSYTIFKYLFLYFYKGDSMSHVNVINNDDEIVSFIEGKYICPTEAFLHLFQLPLHYQFPSVVQLTVHLPNEKGVTYLENDTIDNILQSQLEKKSKLEAFFQKNITDPFARTLYYSNFPRYYKFNGEIWEPRQKSTDTIGRLVFVNPTDFERYALKLLLCHTKGKTSFNDIKTVNNIEYDSFTKAAKALHLINDDEHIIKTLNEAVFIEKPAVLRLLFATILRFKSLTL